MSPTAALALPLIAPVCALLTVGRAESPSGFTRASILERAPFANGAVAAKPATKDSGFVLRGFYTSEKGLEVSLTKVETQESAWVLVGDDAAKWPVPEADPRAGTAELRLGEEKFHLALEKPLASPETKLAIPNAQPAASVADAPKSQNKSPRARSWKVDPEVVAQGYVRAKAEHPEWFDDSPSTDAQREEKRVALSAIWDDARDKAAAKEPPANPGTENAKSGSEE